ncbi:pilus assembly protein CpaE [Paramicrobacterium agarici]|uniref:Pilus assembly protein CpaE n=1 Tax=Paramicrobacterium agarici TaxID=630514 RepID=A0A2A9DSV0_9MICO|nr:pilus assembly protein CpaE [Microbacterium agarici]PFG29768.1 hypothetical protein ATJ78_0683 [Microbacterium agarici]
MISTPLAHRLREAGLRWTPVSGDAFQVAGPEFEGDVFTVSDMTIEAHTYPTGTILGFNGTTEWALDSVALDDAVWLPREDQLRDMLAGAFERLERVDAAGGVEYRVTVTVGDDTATFVSDDPAESYGMALLGVLQSLR